LFHCLTGKVGNGNEVAGKMEMKSESSLVLYLDKAYGVLQVADGGSLTQRPLKVNLLLPGRGTLANTC